VQNLNNIKNCKTYLWRLELQDSRNIPSEWTLPLRPQSPMFEALREKPATDQF
jgi:hypothetical protein